MRPPAFQFYVDDFLAGTLNFSDAELGLYIRLLCVQWSAGSVPNDDTEIASYGRGKTPTARVKAKFELCDDGQLRNKRLEAEREKQAEWRRKSALGGHRSGEARAKGGSTTLEPDGQPKGNTPVSSLQSPLSGLQTPSKPEGDGLVKLPFESDAFKAAWTQWEQHRREIRKRLTPTAIKLAFSDLEAMGEERAIAAIRHSISKNYQGIFEDRSAARAGLRSPNAEHRQVTSKFDKAF